MSLETADKTSVLRVYSSGWVSQLCVSHHNSSASSHILHRMLRCNVQVLMQIAALQQRSQLGSQALWFNAVHILGFLVVAHMCLHLCRKL